MPWSPEGIIDTQPAKMWLINTKTLGLEYFAVPENTPPYAVLSHTWGNDELSFAEFKSLNSAATSRRRGFRKIYQTCALAQQSGIPYAWVDTVCIDKSSSAELTEAINSMYNYYRRSKICYAYIDDWEPAQRWVDLAALGELAGEKTTARKHHRPLRWFTRGWTLQELIAPIHVCFLDAAWRPRGMKNDREVTPHLSRITGIASSVLNDGDSANLRRICLAQRMSWAAHRETSRVEDIAYCLMGIFEVNMPLLYGEGKRAFLRLQQDIIKNTTDLSIFAWDVSVSHLVFTDVLAPHPRVFANLGTCAPSRSPFSRESEITVTNRGLRIYTAPFKRKQETSSLIYVDLCCATEVGGAVDRRFLVLRNLSDDLYGRFCFTSPRDSDLQAMARTERQALYIAQAWDDVANRFDESLIYIAFPGDFDEDPSSGPYRLQVSASWPPFNMAKQLNENISSVDVTGMPWFMGYLSFNILVKPDGALGQGPRRIGDELVVVYFGGGSSTGVKVEAELVKRTVSSGFMNFVGTVEELHPQITQEKLSDYLLASREAGHLVKSFAIPDTVRRITLGGRVDVNTEKGTGRELIEISLYELGGIDM